MIGAAVVVILGLCGCDPLPGGPLAAPVTPHRPPSSAPLPSASSATTTIPAALAPPAPVQWAACGGGLECGSVTVPLNYADTQGTTIQIALVRHPAENPSQRIGSLVINPGGPGVSGVDDMDNELGSLSTGLLDDFDIVTYDPRGVQRSDPVTCGETPASPSSPASSPGPVPPAPDPVPQTPASEQTLIAAFRSYAAACEKASGALLRFVGTVESAQDLDRIRAAIGDPTLTFMGQSYGTLLGATYAEMFPTHVRAMVLDSAIDPTLSSNQMVVGQAVGFEQSLDDFFTWCAASSCPWRPSGDPTAAVLTLINNSLEQPIPAGAGHSIGPGEIYDALLAGLYARSDWPTLADALGEAASGNGAGIVSMSDHYDSNGSSNGADAGAAISCLDHPVSRTLSTYPKLAAADGALAPVFGPLLAWGQAGCAVWPVPATRTPGRIRATGAPPILVVGTTGDPATPYAWAVSLAKQLQRGVLLTRDGVDHVAYFYSSCVRGIVQSYLVAGTVPAPGTTCTS